MRDQFRTAKSAGLQRHTIVSAGGVVDVEQDWPGIADEQAVAAGARQCPGGRQVDACCIAGRRNDDAALSAADIADRHIGVARAVGGPDDLDTVASGGHRARDGQVNIAIADRIDEDAVGCCFDRRQIDIDRAGCGTRSDIDAATIACFDKTRCSKRRRADTAIVDHDTGTPFDADCVDQDIARRRAVDRIDSVAALHACFRRQIFAG